MTLQSDYLQLLDLTYQVAQSLEGRPAPDHRLRDCNELAAKLFFHAATIYWLRQGTRAPVPESSEGGAFFYDFASVLVLTRSVLETYMTMFELFFEQVTIDEKEFRHALWLLSGFVIRESYVLLDPALQASTIAKSQHEIEEMRERIRRTATFDSLTPGQQNDVLGGRRPRGQDRPGLMSEERFRAAGFGSEMTRILYRYYSGYVHSDGLSTAQIVEAETKEEQTAYIEGCMRIVMIVMSKMILEYRGLFPSAEAWCLAKPRAFQLAEFWSRVASLFD